MTPEELFVEIAASYINCPYIWGGKGDLIFDTQKLVLNKNPFGPTHPLVFDCSGLITYSLRELANELDLDLPPMTGSHSAKTILDTFPKAKSTNQFGQLLLYPQHVAIDVGNGFCLDAHRGTADVLTPQQAKAKKAAVLMHRNTRNPKGILGVVRIPLDRRELRT